MPNTTEEKVTFDVVKEYGVISESSTGWKKCLKLISWNKRDPKYDIRDWSPEEDRPKKGLTFTKEEMISLKELLNNIEL